jgi:methylphosphotriester-DNA--protein-cysteine methyltransferase
VEVGTPGINPVATTRVNATTMPKQKKHSRAEIARKLAQASHLARQGKLQNEIARKLNVSVMTLHRWRKAPLGARPVHKAGQPTRRAAGTKLLNSSSKIHCCGDW